MIIYKTLLIPIIVMFLHVYLHENQNFSKNHKGKHFLYGSSMSNKQASLKGATIKPDSTNTCIGLIDSLEHSRIVNENGQRMKKLLSNNRLVNIGNFL